jgi:hypothetical protein
MPVGGVNMSEDINSKIQQMAELLGQDEMPDNVKSLLSMLAGALGGSKDSDNQPENVENTDVPSDEPGTVFTRDSSRRPENFSSGFNTEDLPNRLKKAINSMGNLNDPRVNLLLAIKPFMNNKRQKKINNCIQLLQITGMTRMLNNQEK